MNDNDGEFWLWLIIFAAAAYFAYDKWFAEDEVPQSGEISAREVSPPEPIRPEIDIFVARTSEGSVWRIDSDTVQGGRDARTGWLTLDHSEDASVLNRTSRELWLIDCGVRSYKVLSRISYSPEGDITYSQQYEAEQLALQYAIPESNGDAVVRGFCMDWFD